MLSIVVFIVIVALVFDFINGFHDAANSIATVVSTRVETTVAIELAASWNPLMKSKTRATMTMKTTMESIARTAQAILRMIPSMTFATSSQRSVTISIVS